MPKITISEEDLTISNQVDVTENIAFIPGITTKEIDEKPRLFKTISSFIEAYGSEPYQFKNDQYVNGYLVLAQEQYEKSFIYALELLNSGLPIYFQNLVKIEGNDTGALQEYYEKLNPATIFNENNYTVTKTIKNVNITVGEYINSFTPFTKENCPYFITNGDSINIEGVITKEEELEDIGLPEGYRFAVKLSGLHKNNDAIKGCVIDVSNGTRNEYPAGTPAFEDNQSNELIVVLNVKQDSVVTVTIKYTSGNVDYVFDFSHAKFREKAIENSSEYSVYSEVLDRWTYNVKFLTTGGYPTILNTESDYDLLKTMATAAAVRADAIALVDTPYDENILTSYTNINDNIDVKENESDFRINGNHNKLNYKLSSDRKDEPTLKYATIIGPGAIFELYNTSLISINEINREDNIPNVRLTGSFGYLLSLVNSVKNLNFPDYLAVAGITRGVVPHILSLISETTGAQSDAVQVKEEGKISLNPIIKVQNYGYCIWGNRTMFPNITSRKHPEGDLAASSFLNIRVMSADVKKVIYNACQKLTFETNNLELWLKFKTEVEPTLEQMVANGALKTPNPYELTRLTETEKATLSVYVKLNTEYAVEDFNVTVGLTDSTVEEAE